MREYERERESSNRRLEYRNSGGIKQDKQASVYAFPRRPPKNPNVDGIPHAPPRMHPTYTEPSPPISNNAGSGTPAKRRHRRLMRATSQGSKSHGVHEAGFSAFIKCKELFQEYSSSLEQSVDPFLLVRPGWI